MEDPGCTSGPVYDEWAQRAQEEAIAAVAGNKLLTFVVSMLDLTKQKILRTILISTSPVSVIFLLADNKSLWFVGTFSADGLPLFHRYINSPITLTQKACETYVQYIKSIIGSYIVHADVQTTASNKCVQVQKVVNEEYRVKKLEHDNIEQACKIAEQARQIDELTADWVLRGQTIDAVNRSIAEMQKYIEELQRVNQDLTAEKTSISQIMDHD